MDERFKDICEKYIEPCEKCRDDYKDNCNPLYSEELEIDCRDIGDPECVAILAEKIYDCVNVENLQFVDKKHTFIIDSYDENDPRYSYETGDPICIDAISLCYDYIGIKDDSTEPVERSKCTDSGTISISYDLQPRCLCATPGSEYIINEYVSLYSEFEGSIEMSNTRKCNTKIMDERVITKARIFKPAINYYAHNLTLRVKGRIGCRKFTATADLLDMEECGNLVKITSAADLGLNFVPVNLYGRISRPANEKVNLQVEVTTCLSADCVETNDTFDECCYDRYTEKPIFTAVVGYSFLVNHKLRHTTEEELAVFVNPNGVRCNEDDRTSECIY